MLETGACRIALPTPNPTDPAVEELGMAMLRAVGKCGSDLPAAAERTRNAEEVWKEHAARTATAFVYIAAAHYIDEDVSYRWQAKAKRWSAKLNAVTVHPDAVRNSSRRFKGPMPSRPISGNLLQDGVLQSRFYWSNRAEAMLGPAVAAAHNRGEAQPMQIADRAAAAPTATPKQASRATKAATAASAEHSSPEEDRASLGFSAAADDRRVNPDAIRARGKFVCSFVSAVALSEQVEAHARCCTGHISWHTAKMTQKGCGGRMVGYCTARDQCPLADGRIVFESDEINPETGNHACTDAYGLAVGTTGLLAEQLGTGFAAMQLGAPADGSKARGAASGVYGFIGNKVQPAVAALWDEEVASVVTAAKARGPMAVALDTAHSCVDNGQHSVTSAIDHQSKEICGVCTSCAGGAATREPVLTDLALDQLDAAGADVALAIVDGARDLQSSLKRRPRVNAATAADQRKTTDVATDTFHGLKSEKKALPKAVKKFVPAMEALLRKVKGWAAECGVAITREFMHGTLTGLIREAMAAEADVRNAPFVQAMQAPSADAIDWDAVCGDAGRMLELLSESDTADVSLGADGQVSIAPGGAAAAEHDEGEAAAAMLAELNAAVEAANAGRAGQLSTYGSVGSIDPEQTLLGLTELAIILVHMRACGDDGVPFADVADAKRRGGSKAELVRRVHDVLPHSNLVKGGVNVVVLLRSKPFERTVQAAVRDLRLEPSPDTSPRSGRGAEPAPKRAYQQLSERELACVRRLSELEQAKRPAPSQNTRRGSRSQPALGDVGIAHPAFSARRALQEQLEPAKLSPRQLQCALAFFGLPLGEDPVAVLRAHLELDVIEEAITAVREAGTLAEKCATEYRDHHSHVIRVCAENWGPMCRTFKAYVIQAAMLAFSQHKQGKHTECRRHIWYACICNNITDIPHP
jgi:hypothetical protein